MQLATTWQGIVPMVILSMAIAGGILTAFVRLTDRNTPIDIGLLHGRMGAAAVVLLVFLTILGEHISASVIPAIGLLMMTVLVGAVLYYIIRRKGILPKTIILLHAVLAASGLAVLVFGLPF